MNFFDNILLELSNTTTNNNYKDHFLNFFYQVPNLLSKYIYLRT